MQLYQKKHKKKTKLQNTIYAMGIGFPLSFSKSGEVSKILSPTLGKNTI